MDPNHNLLFALAAVAAGKVSPGQLAAAARIGGAGDAADLGERMVLAGFLNTQERERVTAMVERELQLRGGNALAAFASLWRKASLSPALADMPAETDPPGPPSGGAVPAEDDRDKAPSGSVSSGISTAAVVPEEPLEPVEPEEAAPARAESLAVCEHAGRYREIRTFATGGTGRILLVHDTHIGRNVAFKQLLSETAPGGGGQPFADPLTVPRLARFLQEARITGQLEHPSIVPVYELGCRADGSLYYTMRLVKGRTLEEEIAARAALTERLGLVTHFLGLCQAVAYAHSRGVIHRDINPVNVMIGAFGETVVIDWGVARVRGIRDIHAGDLRAAVNRMRETDAGVMEKAACYMPPEQASGDPEALDERSDIYALGAVLYAILAGKPPHDGLAPREFLERVSAFLPRPVRHLEPRVPGELVAICGRAMDRDPEKRYVSAQALAEEVQRYLSGGYVGAYEYHFAEMAHRFAERHRRALAAVTVAVAALLVLDVYSCMRVYRERNAARMQARISAQEGARANAARDLAEQARLSAEADRITADRERTQAEHELYYANIALAQRSVQESRMGQARSLLEAAPAALRDWEWRHLVREANADGMVLRTGGLFAAFCDEGRLLVTARPNGMVAANDLATGEKVRTFVESSGFGSAAAVDLAGVRLAVSSARAVAVWNVADGRELFRFDEPGDALTRNFLALSADGRRVAALDTDRRLRVWDVDSGAVVFERPVRSQQGFEVWLSPNGTQMLLASADLGEDGLERAVSLLDLPSGKKVGRADLGDVISVHGAAFSPDGARVAFALDSTVQVWNCSQGDKIREINGRFDHPDTLAFSPDGVLLAAGTADGEVILWDRSKDSEQRVSRAHAEAVRRVAFRPDGKWLATAGMDRVARIWECPALRPIQTLRGHDRPLLSVAFNPAGDKLVTGSSDGTSRLWNLTRELDYITPRAVAASGAAGIIAGAVDGGIALWNTGTGMRTATLDTAAAKVRLLAFDRAGTRLAATVETPPHGRAVLLWNTADGSSVIRIPVSADAARVEFTGAQDQFVALRSGSWLDVYDAVSGASVWKLSGVVDLAFRADGAQIAVCTLPEDPTLMREQQEVALYDTVTWAKSAQFIVPTSFTAALTWSPDQKRIALGAQVLSEKEWRGGAYLWNLSHPDTPQWLQGHDSLVSAIAFDAAGEKIATGGKDGRLVLWQTDTGTEQWRAAAHGGDIQDVAFSPEGTRVATAGRDGAFKLWDAGDGREVLALPVAGGNDATPAKVCFDRQGRYLLTITEPAVQPPLVHWAVPVSLTQPSDTPLQDRIETWKRTGK